MKKLLFVFSALALLAVGYGLFRWTFKQTGIQTTVAQKAKPASAVLVTNNNTATLAQVAQPAIYPNGGLSDLCQSCGIIVSHQNSRGWLRLLSYCSLNACLFKGPSKQTVSHGQQSESRKYK